MKPNTTIWYQLESVGRPETTIRGQARVSEIIKIIAEWLLGVYMGQKIRINLARREEELSTDRRSAEKSLILHDLESMLDGLDGVDQEETSE